MKEIHSNRKFGSHCFCKIKKPNKNFLKLKKILTGFLFFTAGCFEGSSDLAGTGSTIFSGGLFLEAAQIWQELSFFSGRNMIDEGARQKT